ncbi:MAG: porin family protein [Agriterribacter sp.]
MKKVIALFGTCLLLSVVTVKAQKAGVMVKAGLNLANVTVNKDGGVDDAKGIASFHAGLQADLPITKFFAIQPGLFFTGKGTKVQWNSITSSTKPYYLELPVNAVVKVPLGEDANFFVGAGPYVAMGIGGKNKISGTFAGIDFNRTENIKFSDDDPFTDGEEGAGYGVMRRFDYGLNGTVGIEGKRALFSVNYGLGLAKLQSGTSSSDDELGKHRVLSFSVGIKL